jgi:hypothetical protein
MHSARSQSWYGGIADEAAHWRARSSERATVEPSLDGALRRSGLQATSCDELRLGMAANVNPKRPLPGER